MDYKDEVLANIMTLKLDVEKANGEGSKSTVVENPTESEIQGSVFSFKPPEVTITPFADNESNPYNFSLFKTSFTNALQAVPNIKSSSEIYLSQI